MKKAGWVLFMLGISSFGFAQSNFVTFEAKIDNRNGDKLVIQGRQYKKEIDINKSGVFKDTLHIKPGMYQLNDGVESTYLYLKNGYELKLKMDAKEFDETIVYTGKGANENNFLAQTALADESFDFDGLMTAEESVFKQKVKEKFSSDIAKLEKAQLDSEFTTMYKKNLEQSEKSLSYYYEQNQAVAKMNNKPSPTFDYENHKGGKTKLEDLKGKYVYVDVWATWCGPCRAEIPHLKEIEKKYHGKNIEFVSISIDTKKDYDKWKNFVKEKELGGVQLFADNDWNSKFVTDFGITGIPRFILIDPKGNVVNANAERPSSPKLQEELDKLLK
jgi:thiol-disulfide isomerase/thioredoxin